MSHDFVFVGCDTDGLAFKKKDEKPFSPEEIEALVSEVNASMDQYIKFANEGMVKRQINIRTKNYILWDPENPKPKKRLIIKGSGLKATTKEKALQRFISELIDLLLKDKKDQIFSLYFKYANDIVNLTDISDWCVKKTVTKSVLRPERTNEQRVNDALDLNEVNEGDKVYMFNETSEELCLRENFKGVYCVETLLKKLYNTLAVFDTILDIDLFPNFSLVRNREMLGLEPKKKTRLKVVTPPLETKLTRKQDPLPENFWNVK